MSPLQREYLWVTVCALPACLALGRLFFGSLAGLLDALRLVLVPDLLSLWRGEWLADQWATLKVALFLALCVGGIVSAHGYFYPS